MPECEVDGFTFTVNEDFVVSKYDDWKFYKNQISLISGAKAVDLVIAARDMSVSYLVEIKDFRVNPVTLERRNRTKPTELHDEIAIKVLDSLGGILAACTQATDATEKETAGLFSASSKVRIVLYLEQSNGGRLFPKVVDPANLQIKLRQKLKGIDPHASVISRDQLVRYSWEVR